MIGLHDNAYKRIVLSKLGPIGYGSCVLIIEKLVDNQMKIDMSNTIIVEDILSSIGIDNEFMRRCVKSLMDLKIVSFEGSLMILNVDLLSGIKQNLQKSITKYNSTNKKKAISKKVEVAVENNVLFLDKELNDTYQKWILHNKQRGKKLTATTIEFQRKKLNKLTCEKAIKTINNSIENNWAGLHPDNKTQEKQKKTSYQSALNKMMGNG